MTPQEIHEQTTTLQVLDVRDPSEFAAGHIPQATHIPLQQLPARAGEVRRDVAVAVICRTGSRSALATRWLVQQGYDARNAHGGMVAWRLQQLPIEDAQGRPGRVI